MIVFEGCQTCGPEKAENPNIYWPEPGGDKFEVDSLEERPNKDADRPCVGELLPPLVVHPLLVLALQDAQPHVEHGQANWSKAGLVHEDLGRQVGHRVLGEESGSQSEPVVDQWSVEQSSINPEPGDLLPVYPCLLGLLPEVHLLDHVGGGVEDAVGEHAGDQGVASGQGEQLGQRHPREECKDVTVEPCEDVPRENCSPVSNQYCIDV